MGTKKNPIRVITNHTVEYEDKDNEGVKQERTFATKGSLEKSKIHDGGSVWVGYVNPVFGIDTPFGEIIVSAPDQKCRIRVDGTLVFEPKDENRTASFFPKTGPNAGEEVRGMLCFDLIGDESRAALAETFRAQWAPLNKKVKILRAELAKRAA